MTLTEQEWLTGTDPQPMLAIARDAGDDRKLRLWACAWAYDVMPDLLDDASRAAVETAERYADGEAGRAELLAAFRGAGAAWDAIEVVRGGRHGKGVRAGEAYRRAKEAAEVARQAADPMLAGGRGVRLGWGRNAARRYALAGHLRDIFGNPFRPVTPAPSWLTPTVAALASAVYADRAFDRLSVLADALEEAGCDDPGVMEHCRGDGPHVRGCWVVDLVLGKS